MSENLLKYLFICGIPHKRLLSLSVEEIYKQTPFILSYYSFNGLSEELKLMKRVLEESNQLEIIFPKKFTPSELTQCFEEFQQESQKSNILEQYIIKSSDKPSSFYHAIEIKYSEGPKESSWYLGIMIFYEKLQNHKTIKDPIFIAKALILVTRYPNYYLSQLLLEHLMEKTIYSIYPLESIIEEWFNTINTPLKNSKDEKTNSNIFNLTINNNNYEYRYYNYYLLKQCDINFPKMLSLFTYDDIITFADNFFQQNMIIVSSNQLNWIFPVFEMFLSILHPFNIVNHFYFYRFLNLSNLYLLKEMPCLVGIYCDKVPEKVINILQTNTGKQVFHIHIYNNNDNIQVSKNISNVKNSMIKNFINYKDIFDIENFEKMFSAIQNFYKKNDIRREQPFYKSTNLSEEKKIQEIRGHFLILFLYFYNKIIQNISLRENPVNDTLSVEVKIVENIQIAESIVDIIEHFNLKSVNYTELSYLVLSDELITQYREKPNYKQSQLLTIDKPSETKIITNLEYLPNLFYYYLNKLQRSKLRLHNKNHIVKTPLQTSFFQFPYFKYNQNELILSWELPDSNLFTKQNSLFQENKRILIEINVFYNLIKKGVRVLSIEEQLCLLVCVGISLMLLNVSPNSGNDKYIRDYFDILYNIFQHSQGFYRKISFLLTLLYRIMKINENLLKKEKDDFVNQLNKFKIIPNIVLRLEYSDKIDMEILEKKTQYQFHIHSMNQLYTCKSIGHSFGNNSLLDKTSQLQCSNCKKTIECKVSYSITNNNEIINRDNTNIKIKSVKIIYLELLELLMKNKTINFNELLQMENKLKQEVIETLINVAFYAKEVSTNKVNLFK